MVLLLIKMLLWKILFPKKLEGKNICCSCSLRYLLSGSAFINTLKLRVYLVSCILNMGCINAKRLVFRQVLSKHSLLIFRFSTQGAQEQRKALTKPMYISKTILFSQQSSMDRKPWAFLHSTYVLSYPQGVISNMSSILLLHCVFMQISFGSCSNIISRY